MDIDYLESFAKVYATTSDIFSFVECLSTKSYIPKVDEPELAGGSSMSQCPAVTPAPTYIISTKPAAP